MRKTIFLLLLTACVLSASAQTKLAGRTYYNANVMTSMMDEMMRESNSKMKADIDKIIAEQEKKSGKKLSAEEKKAVREKAIAASKEYIAKMIKTSITINFKDETHIAIDTDMTLDEEAMKKAGIGWLQRKALKALVSVMPDFKGEYIVRDNLVVVYDGSEPTDTIRISSDGKKLYGRMDDTNYTLTRIK